MSAPTPPSPAPDLAALQARLAAGLDADPARAALTERLAREQARRSRQLAQIHLAAKALDLDEHSYRAGIVALSGGRVSSAAGLDRREREALLADYQRGGWRPTLPKGVRATRPARFKVDLTSKVRALLADARRPDAYADAIADRSFGLPRWEWLNWEQLRKLAQMLIIDQRRRGRRTAP